MFKIYGYFKGNLGDDLMLKQLIDNLGEQNCEIILGKSNYVYDDFVNIKKSPFIDIFKRDYKSLIFVGGSTIQKPPRFFCYMTLFHIKMILSLFILRIQNKQVIYWNTNLYSGKSYERLLRLYLPLITKMYVRDEFSTSVLIRNEFSNYKLIYDLVDELDISKYITTNPEYIGISLTETQSLQYIKNKLQNIKVEIPDDKPVMYIEFQQTNNRQEIEELLTRTFNDIKIVRYESIEKTLKEFGKIRYMYCDRFHSVVLSKCFNIEANYDSYDVKTTNYLNTATDKKVLNFELFSKYRDEDER